MHLHWCLHVQMPLQLSNRQLPGITLMVEVRWGQNTCVDMQASGWSLICKRSGLGDCVCSMSCGASLLKAE